MATHSADSAADPRRGLAAANRHGGFDLAAGEYVVLDPKTPRPWANIIANPRMGLAVSQTGSGFSWIDNSQLGTITNWRQEFAEDCAGKFLYLRDDESGDLWSLSPAPTWAATDEFSCRHGFGYTTFRTVARGIEAAWTLFVHPVLPVELWRVELVNVSGRARRLALTAFLEWCCGVSPAPRREFHKLFLGTDYDASRGAVFARNRMWDVPNAARGHWNTDFPYVCAFGCSAPVRDAQGDKGLFLGRCGSLRAPEALAQASWTPRFGRHEDPVAALRSPLELAAGERRVVVYALAAGKDRAEAESLLDGHRDAGVVERALADARAAWRSLLAAHRIETPDEVFDALANDLVRYQAISARLWGRCGYYQQSGAFGFRDQLQDSQVYLTIDPARCRTQLRLHAAHQFADGSVYHWWHPLTEQGHVTKMTDDLLWMSFVAANYVKETGDLSILDDEAPFLDDPRPAPLREHVRRAFERAFRRTSPRGLPYIGGGDWNDGLSACGLAERGESVWLAEFLVGILRDWAEVLRRAGDAAGAAALETKRAAYAEAVNRHGWDGAWYLRGTLDDGTPFGSAKNRVGKIYLNAQVWAVLNDVAPADRAARAMAAVEEHLVDESGALLLAPAYDEPDPAIGYITRYAAGLRENGGVYTHAASWAIAAAAKTKNAPLVAKLLEAIDPTRKDPDRYWAEPYVLPGNVDGPASPHHTRGGWTWYTGSAAWLHRVVAEWVVGVRPEWGGLRFDPCLPPRWDRARVVRPYRGALLEIEIERAGLAAPEATYDGRPLAGALLAETPAPGTRHAVRVRF